MHDLILLISMPGGAEWILILVGLPLYFLPSIIAIARRHPQTTAIVILNFVLGWTLAGWVGTLIWAFLGAARPATIVGNLSGQELKPEKPGFSEQTQSDAQKRSTPRQD